MAAGNYEDDRRRRRRRCCCSRIMPSTIRIHIAAPASYVQIGVPKRDCCLFSASRCTLQENEEALPLSHGVIGLSSFEKYKL
jgi:hypothetical protein